MIVKRIGIFYHSGTGGTRTVAEALAGVLSARHEVGVHDIHHADCREPSRWHLLVFGYPTFFLRSTPSMDEYVASMPPLAEDTPAFVFTTAALYAENSARRFCLGLEKKGIRPIGAVDIRSPASDGTLTSPPLFAPSLYSFEKRAARKILKAASIISTELDSAPDTVSRRRRIPPAKWYTPFVLLPQLLLFNGFIKMKDRLRASPDRCVRCGRCARGCPRKAWTIDGGLPRHDGQRCELCLRCVHHCPRKAIGWDEKMMDRTRLTEELHRLKKEELRARIEQAALHGRGRLHRSQRLAAR